MMIEYPFVPKHADGVLRVIVPGRISDPKQDIKSIDAAQEDNENWLRSVHNGPIEFRRLGEQASGWLADRPSMELAEALIESGKWDLVLVGEVREIYRNPSFQWSFTHLCLDNDMRFISRFDGVDTAKEDWENLMHFAITRCGMAVPETRRRVKRKATHEFGKGGMVLKVRFGYRKLTPEEADSGEFGPKGLKIGKQPGCEETFVEMRRRVLAGQTVYVIACWLIEAGVPVGPYVTSGKWSGRVVRGLLTDPILSGQRQFRKSLSRMFYKTGKHKAIDNPSPLQDEHCPALAYYAVQEHEKLLKVLSAKRKGNRAHQKTGRVSPLWNVSRGMSLWPGQALTCGACGGTFYQLGAVMKCQNTLPDGQRTCWNHVSVTTATVRKKILPQFVKALERHPSAAVTVATIAWNEYVRLKKARDTGRRTSGQTLAQLDRELANLVKALKRGSDMDSVVREISALEKEKKKLIADAKKETGVDGFGEYTSAEEIRGDLPAIVGRLANTSRSFSLLLRECMPECTIVPVQALDRPQVRPRLRLAIRLPGEDCSSEPGGGGATAIDLFDPPLHIAHAARCAAARSAKPGLSLRELAAELGINYMAVKRALDYARRMEREGTTEPYRELHEAPQDASRWKKYKSKTSPSDAVRGMEHQRKEAAI